MEVVSPGGLPSGVTPDNILSQQHPRNRRLAEAMNRIGLVERAGQGVNLMVERSVQQGKELPSYAGTSAHEVRLTLAGLVTSPALLAGVERIGEEKLQSFSTEDFVVLDRLQRGQEVSAELRPRLPVLREMGVLESVGRGRNVRYFLSRRLSVAIGQAGTYTRRRGLDHGANKELLVEHLRQVAGRGSDMAELQQVLPALSRYQVQRLLRELRDAGRVRMEGGRRWARWFHNDTPN
jgi:ATP-dependent DNA helicase RecG